MARNYSIAEATRIICEGTDKEAMLDIGRRYPLLAIKLAVITAKAPEIVELMACAPDYLSANKMNKGLKDGVTESDDAEDQDDEQDTEVEEEKPAKRAGKRGAVKKPAKKAEPEDDDDEEEEEAETESGDDANPYAGKSAVELYKECKKRGLKVKSKMKASEYAAALVEDDNKGSGSDDAEDGDDWDEDEPEEKPAKKAPKGKKAPVKKAKEEDEDDDDDWDI